jgi:hypothetical protein
MIARVETGMSPNNVTSWTAEAAVAELLQNVLDAPAASYDIDLDDTGTLTVSDDGPGMQRRHLAFGLSEKGHDAAGQFGHGLKQAMLVLLAANRPFTLRTRTFSCRPAIEVGALETPCLTLYLDDTNDLYSGTLISTECTPEELADAKNRFPALDPTRTMINDSISEPGGSIFVNGVRVSSIPALFSYHLTGKDAQAITTDRRQTIDTNRLQSLLPTIIANAPLDVCLTILKSAASRVDQLEYLSIYGWSRDPHPNWTTAFYAAYGAKACLKVGDMSEDRLQYLGYTPVELPYYLSNFMQHLVRNSYTIAQECAQTRNPVKLTRTEVAAWKRIEHFLTYKGFTIGQVSFAASLALASGETANGLWDSKTQTIWLSTDQLANWQDAAGIILHELAHKESNSPDGSTTFEAVLTSYFARLI